MNRRLKCLLFGSIAAVVGAAINAWVESAIGYGLNNLIFIGSAVLAAIGQGGYWGMLTEGENEIPLEITDVILMTLIGIFTGYIVYLFSGPELMDPSAYDSVFVASKHHRLIHGEEVSGLGYLFLVLHLLGFLAFPFAVVLQTWQERKAIVSEKR